MKKNISRFVVGALALLCVSFFVFTKDKTAQNAVSSTQIKSEIINSNAPSPLSKEELPYVSPAQIKDKNDCKKDNGTCCKDKKHPSSSQKALNEGERAEKKAHLEALEDPTDITSVEKLKGNAEPEQKTYKEASEIEFEKTKDPALGYVPSERLLQAMETTHRLQEQREVAGAHLRGALSNVRWLERGPTNIGGRTRAIQVDLNDKTGNTIFAGGVAGGLFKATDVSGTAKWERINDWLDNLTVGSIAQDPTNPKVLYVGTGDTDGAGAFVPGTGGTVGVGIYKSVDGGKSWNLLPATSAPRTVSYQYVTKIIVTPDSGHIFAATFVGVFKSRDGGVTWKIVLGGKTWDISRGSDGRIYAAQDKIVQISKQNGEAGTFTSMASGTGFPTNLSRTQVACAPSNPEVVYVVGNISNNGSAVFRSNNGGATWSTGTVAPGPCQTTGNFTNGQAWYDLCIMVDPLNETMVWLGGVEQFRSPDGGATWTQMTGGYCATRYPYAHPDQHLQHFDPMNPSVLYLGNDGGVFRVTNPSGKVAIKELNNGYTTTQYYACAIHPDSASNYLLAGAQDNGSHAVAGSKGINGGKAVLGGDGFYCFIDQDNPNIQIASSQFGNWALSKDGGATFGSGGNSNGGFYCPADYDSRANILYAQTGGGDLWRWKVGTTEPAGVVDMVDVSLNGNIAQIYADPNVPNRIYVGTRSGTLYRVDSANVGTTLPNTLRLTSFGSGYISSIEVEKGNANHILVCLSNYGVVNVQESKDGGATWTGSDGNLPDMPIRWGIFNPNNPTQAMIATDAGVWTTELLSGASTTWIPPVPGRGIPVVRTDMLQWRESDKTVLAATYGRGLWTTTVFGKAAASIEYPQVAYLDVPLPLKGESSVAADNFLWKFSDNTTDTLENTSKIYKAIGTYDVSLTINKDNNLTAKGKIKILPSLPTPYKTSTEGYAGNFDAPNWDPHFGAWSAAGSKFVRGKSGVFGKDRTHSGAFAYVIDPLAQSSQKNSIAYLQLPNFDLTKTGIYQFSFWANYDLQLGYDGLQVEYSLDKGASWKILGSRADADWYNNTVTTSLSAFKIGEPFITGTADDWTRFKLNISNFAGNANVAFRFVFKSADLAPGAGCAIDDVVISRFEGTNTTAIIAQSGAFNRAGNSIDISFQTQPEYYAQTFDVEMSSNGRDWKPVAANIKATGGSTEELQGYSATIPGTPLDLYYFRIHSVSGNAAINYALDFRTTPFVVKRNKDVALGINKIFPSPFSKTIGITFTDAPNADVVYELFDVAGRLISSQIVAAFTGVYQELSVPNLPKAMYLLRVKIGENKPESVKLFGGN